ncbi:MAG: hypothetical protein M3329_01005 [Pseudomonadota bacterium]|nr:hypothetical protein [Pseudomonadota bacterium]
MSLRNRRLHAVRDRFVGFYGMADIWNVASRAADNAARSATFSISVLRPSGEIDAAYEDAVVRIAISQRHCRKD